MVITLHIITSQKLPKYKGIEDASPIAYSIPFDMENCIFRNGLK